MDTPMEDVHMEVDDSTTAQSTIETSQPESVTVVAKSASNPESFAPPSQPELIDQDQKGGNNAASLSNAAASASKDTSTEEPLQSSATEQPGDKQPSAPEYKSATPGHQHEDMTMDVDTVPPAQETLKSGEKSEATLKEDSSQQVATSSVSHTKTSASESQGPSTETTSAGTAVDSTAQPSVPIVVIGEPENAASSATETEAPTATATPANSVTTEAGADPSKLPPSSSNFDSVRNKPALPPQPAVRAYVPQFKFTTFAPQVGLPTRNVTSNFLKTEKNFVLKDLATKQKRRKRKAPSDEETKEEGGTEVDGEIKENNGASPTDSEALNGDDAAALAIKKKKHDELAAIRKGIFADEEDEDEKDEDQDEDKDKEDQDEDEFTSDSDSEHSVVDEMDENGETQSSSDTGKKIIVIHPGSKFLRIGRASDAYPVVIPHCIARRMRKPAVTAVAPKIPKEEPVTTETTTTTTSESETTAATAAEDEEAKKKEEEESNGMDVDVDEEEEEQEHENDEADVVNDQYLQVIEYDLKQRMKAAKRRPVPNAKTQVRSFNTSTRPERILDHNDPYKVEWTDPAAESEYIIGQKALNLPPGKNHTFKLRWPIVGGKLNDMDYTTPRVVVSDLETIWTKVIEDDLGIDHKTFRKHYALLVIPDLYSKVYVTELVGMLLRSMQFKGVMVQQESVCASFGAGVSAACVVDIGAEVTKVACVEDGICIPNSRAVLKYGGDDITRCFSALVQRTGFPYEDLDLAQTYDWRLMEDLKEKWCTMNEADLTVQVYSFFVRKPEHQTEKYQVKVYDEVAISPMCLFFPGVIRRWIEEREIAPSFAKLTNYEDINEDAPAISLMNQNTKKTTVSASAAAAAAAAARAGTPTVAGEENVGTPQAGTPVAATPVQTPAPSVPLPPSVPVIPAVIPFAMEPSVTTTDKSWEIAGTIGKDHFSSLVALDVVVAQCISNCGSEERSKKLYGSIILVGGGGMVKGFDRVLEDRLFQALPATLTTVEKVEVLPSPREMDPRLLVWKGASVLGKLETANELWIKPLEWELMGRKILRDKALFVWQSKE
ncbi:actin-like protein arp8 [Gryganskiella cystojenkinii]|nr:actin-like protein arp8 [Gryganskiella cystojenkinii]